MAMTQPQPVQPPAPAPEPRPQAPASPAPGHTPLVERVLEIEKRLAQYEPFIVDVVRELGL